MLQNKRIALLLALTLALLAHACTAVKLRVQNVECIHEEIAEPDSLVTIVLVAGDYDDEPVYFDFVARDPMSTVIFSKLEQNDAEFAFKTRQPGRHSFCLTLSKKSSGRHHVATRVVQLDVLVGNTYAHNKITEDHLDELISDVSVLKELVQKLLSETRRLRFREERHRRTVESTDRRVRRYAYLKVAVIVGIAIMQPIILSRFFKDKL